MNSFDLFLVSDVFVSFLLTQEEMRKAERKNRDEFRKLMEEHVAAGTLTAKTLWRDYYMMVRVTCFLYRMNMFSY